MSSQQWQRSSEGHNAGEITSIRAANHPKCQKTVLDEFLLCRAVTQTTGRMGESEGMRWGVKYNHITNTNLWLTSLSLNIKTSFLDLFFRADVYRTCATQNHTWKFILISADSPLKNFSAEAANQNDKFTAPGSTHNISVWSLSAGCYKIKPTLSVLVFQIFFLIPAPQIWWFSSFVYFESWFEHSRGFRVLVTQIKQLKGCQLELWEAVIIFSLFFKIV